MIFLAEVHVKSRWLFMSCVVGRLWPERTTSCSTVESIVVNCPVLQALPTKHHIFQFRLQTHLSFSKENVVHCLCTLIQTCYLVFVDISTSEKKILLLEYFIQDVSGYICDASNHHHLDITNQQPNVSTLLSSVHASQEQENIPHTLVLRNIIIKSSRPKCFFFCHAHHVQITIIN